MTITTTANEIKSHKDPPLTVGVEAAAAGVLTGSDDALAVTAGVVSAATGLLTASDDVLAVTVGVAAAAAGVLTGSEDRLGRAGSGVG